jgi:CDP-6-deoxy-D-xylo-4-hexulose-3-dehydrase
MTFYELSSSSWDHEEVDAIQRVVASGQYTMGQEVFAFEREFAAASDMRYAVMVNSGSSANLIATAALFFKADRPLQAGDEVIVPALSWGTTYHPLVQYGLKLRFVDIELDTLNIDTAALEAALTPRTRMLVAVSILGNPAALDVLRRFADAHDLYFLEDNCESLGAEVDGRKAGSFGDLSTCSFFFAHHLSTMEGGVVLTNDLELADLCRALRAHGWTRDLSENSPLYERRSGEHFEAYRFLLPGYNVRPMEFQGATGRVQLRKLPGLIEARRRNLALFQELFAGDERFIIQREHGKSSSYSFTIVLNPAVLNPGGLNRAAGIDRDRVFAALKANDIQFRMVTGGCYTRHDVIRHCDYSIAGELKNANIVHDYGLFVGNHPKDISAQLHRLREVLDGIGS